LDFKRIQFTPDLLPGDILGGNILQTTATGEKRMEFQPGAIFANIVLADEINRASPKTQSAMLEAMQERSVTLQGETHRLPEPFFVLASQNPIEQEGTYPIPEAQLDRFLLKLQVKGVDAKTLARIVSERRRGETPPPALQLSRQELERLFQAMERMFLSQAVAGYIGRLVEAAHPDSSSVALVRQYVHYGPSPRGAIALAEAARGEALIQGRPTVGFEDVAAVAEAVLNHRLILNYQARLDGVSPEQIVQALLAEVER
jgi:MoxR-like ATPase